MNTEKILSRIPVQNEHSEIFDMLIQAEELRRRLNKYLQRDRDTGTNELRREKLADASEDLYSAEVQLGEVIGYNVTKMVINW